MKRILISVIGMVSLLGSASVIAATVEVSTLNSGGQRVGSSHYTLDASIGEIGTVTAGANATVAKTGYEGQLFDVSGLQAGAFPSSVNEGQTTSLECQLLLDDDTLLTLDPAAVSWTILSGPVAGVSADGMVTVQNVFSDTPASVRGSYAGFMAKVDLTVINTGKDDYGIYAADGIPDDWQVVWFGVGDGAGNPAGVAPADPDLDGRTNLFEYVTGSNPTEFTSTATTAPGSFLLNIEIVPDQPTWRRIVFGPRISGLEYVVQSATSLEGGAWSNLTNANTTDNGAMRIVTALNAIDPVKFYRVLIANP